ncbi:reverse transcriptase [Tanacetum coccineum]
MINELVVIQQFLVNDVNRLKNGEGSSRFSRMSKLEFIKFHREDVKGWIYRVKEFFTVDGVMEEDKVKIVSIHIYDRALAWHLQFVRAQGENVTWTMYEEAILKRFREVNEDLMADCLPSTIEMNVRMFRPRTLADAFSLLNFQEIALALTKHSPQISLKAISGTPTFNTMRMKAIVAKHLLHLLIDTGSTHNFLDLFTAKKIGYKMTKTYTLQVIVVGGSKMVSQYMVYGFQWLIQGYQFKIDAMLLPLGGCEMVLGIQWLSTLGNIELNFHELVMKFMYEGQKVRLMGTKQAELQ